MNRYVGKTREQVMREMEEEYRTRYDAKHGTGAYEKAEQERQAFLKRQREIDREIEKQREIDRHELVVKIARYYSAMDTAPDACILATLRG